MNLKLLAPAYFFYLFAFIVFLGLKEHYHWAGRWVDGAYGGFGALLMQLFRETSKSISKYVPVNKLDAKIANERIKLLATTVNALALAVGAIGVLGPMITTGDGPFTNPVRVIAIVLAFWMHLSASQMLKNLKDEEGPFASVEPA